MSTMSIWQATSAPLGFGALAQDASADVVVVGGGITGVTLAWLLACEGRSVVLLEARQIGSGDTGGSTGNLYQTVSGGLQEVRRTWGDDAARDVAASRGEAVAFVERQANRLGAQQCGFRRCPLYISADTQTEAGHIRDEYHAMREAGLPVSLEDHLPPGPPQSGGIVAVLPDQAQFHPLAYVRALANDAVKQGARIYERTTAVEIDAAAACVRTAGGTVRSRHIVLATHSPSGKHRVQLGMLARREYGLAVRLDAPFPPGIFWGRGDERLSLRALEFDDSHYLICIGQQGQTGRHDAEAAAKRLKASVAQRLGHRDVQREWSAQHFHSPDHLPFIGQDGSGCHIATGFATDGLTYGTLAALIIVDALLGRTSRWSDLYRAERLDLVKSARGILETGVATAEGLIANVPPGAKRALASLAPGEADLVEHDGDTVAAYRDADGTLFAVSSACTHMGCRVRWNALESSWDCPCHGSRFAPDGSLLEGPATQPLARVN